jgi:hypothetical protein
MRKRRLITALGSARSAVAFVAIVVALAAAGPPSPALHAQCTETSHGGCWYSDWWWCDCSCDPENCCNGIDIWVCAYANCDRFGFLSLSCGVTGQVSNGCLFYTEVQGCPCKGWVCLFNE